MIVTAPLQPKLKHYFLNQGLLFSIIAGLSVLNRWYKGSVFVSRPKVYMVIFIIGGTYTCLWKDFGSICKQTLNKNINIIIKHTESLHRLHSCLWSMFFFCTPWWDMCCIFRLKGCPNIVRLDCGILWLSTSGGVVGKLLLSCTGGAINIYLLLLYNPNIIIIRNNNRNIKII